MTAKAVIMIVLVVGFLGSLIFLKIRGKKNK